MYVESGNGNETRGFYLDVAKENPILSPDVQRDLAREARLTKDLTLRQRLLDRLLLSNLGLALDAAYKLRRGFMEGEHLDWVHEAFVGLLDAVHQYDPDYKPGSRNLFSTFGYERARNSVRDAIPKQGTIRIPVSLVNLIKEVRGAVWLVRKAEGFARSLDEIVVELCERRENLKRGRVEEAMRKPNFSSPISLSGPLKYEDGGELSDFVEHLKTKPPEYEVYDAERKIEVDGALEKMFSVLSEMERIVIVLGYGLYGFEKRSKAAIGRMCNYTRSRIQQIEKEAMGKLHEFCGDTDFDLLVQE
ncbi:MAG: sigma-70 family RNA polymerase sigma factor [Candidatus Woesearchaeota archaeon]